MMELSKKQESILRKRLVVKDTGRYGKGVYARENIRKGQVIYVLGGKRMTLGELVSKVLSGKERIDDPFQIGRRTYIDLDEFSRTFNHSCDPVGGLRKNSELFALRDIKRGEQITYDYSTTVAPTDWDMRCRCGSRKCRHTIGDISSIPKAQLNFYKREGALQRYMRVLLQEIESGDYIMPRYEELALERMNAL